jgi:hypothetical protein
MPQSGGMCILGHYLPRGTLVDPAMASKSYAVGETIYDQASF